MQKKVMLLAVAAAWVIGGLPSAAQGPSTVTPTAGEETLEYQGLDPQCIAELEKLCEGIQPGGGRIRKCYQENEHKLSPACRQQILERKKERAADPISLTNQAIVELTDAPALGGRTTVDLNKRWGSDVGQIKKATALLQEALSNARSANASPAAIRKLEEAIDYGRSTMHKETRLNASGALFHLCKGSGGGGDVCGKVPKYGAYVAP
jgi:hypothetical protein